MNSYMLIYRLITKRVTSAASLNAVTGCNSLKWLILYECLMAVLPISIKVSVDILVGLFRRLAQLSGGVT